MTQKEVAPWDDSSTNEVAPWEDNNSLPNSPFSLASYTSAIARPILQVGGAVGAGIAGGLGSGTAIPGVGAIPGAITGGALGYAGGTTLADLLDRAMGIKPPLKNVNQALKEVGGNLESGMGVEASSLLLNPLLQGAGKMALKGASAYLGPSTEAIQARIANPELEKYSYPVVAQNLSDNLNTLQDNLSKIEDNVWGSLLKLKAEPKSVLTGMLNNIKGQIMTPGLGAVSEADQTALDAINRLSEKIGSYTEKGREPLLEQFFDQHQLRSIIQSVSDDINFQDPSASTKNEALLKFRHYLSDYLKGENPQYADLIQQSAERTDLLNNAQKTFSLKKVQGDFVPSDATPGKIKSILGGMKPRTENVAQHLQDLTGMNLSKEAQLAKYASEFENTATQGSRRVGLGGTVGAAIGSMFGNPMIGAGVGAMGGGYLDRFAAQNLGKTLDAANSLGLLNLQVSPQASLGLTSAIGSQFNK